MSSEELEVTAEEWRHLDWYVRLDEGETHLVAVKGMREWVGGKLVYRIPAIVDRLVDRGMLETAMNSRGYPVKRLTQKGRDAHWKACVDTRKGP